MKKELAIRDQDQYARICSAVMDLPPSWLSDIDKVAFYKHMTGTCKSILESDHKFTVSQGIKVTSLLVACGITAERSYELAATQLTTSDNPDTIRRQCERDTELFNNHVRALKSTQKAREIAMFGGAKIVVTHGTPEEFEDIFRMTPTEMEDKFGESLTGPAAIIDVVLHQKA